MLDVVILSAVRTPMGAFGGQFKYVEPRALASHALSAALLESGLAPEDIHEVCLGQVYPAAGGPNIARLASHLAGIPPTTPSFTLNHLCGSGMRAVDLAHRLLPTDGPAAVIAGGVECMTRVPYLLTDARWGRRVGGSQALDGLLQDGLHCPLTDRTMAELADNLALRAGLTREALDDYAFQSHGKASKAWRAGVFAREVRSMEVRRGQGLIQATSDESVRHDLQRFKLATLQALNPRGGLVTAGNASPLSDGAAALVMASGHPRGRARILGFGHAAGDPADLVGPVVRAIQTALERASLPLHAMDRIELNEAFASQILATQRALPDLDPARMNVRGGALALGHPVGASGARILVTLLHCLEDEGLKYGLAALCIGGGQGMAMIMERLP